MELRVSLTVPGQMPHFVSGVVLFWNAREVRLEQSALFGTLVSGENVRFSLEHFLKKKFCTREGYEKRNEGERHASAVD